MDTAQIQGNIGGVLNDFFRSPFKNHDAPVDGNFISRTDFLTEMMGS